MKKKALLSEAIWVFEPDGPEMGPAVLPSVATNVTLVIDEGEPLPLVADAGGVTDLTVSAAKPVASIAQLADYLVNGFWQYNGTIAHRFASNTITYNINALNSAEQFLAVSAMQGWQDVANINFVQTSGAANLTFSNSGSMQAYTSAAWYSSGAIAYANIVISSDWITSDGGAKDGKTGIDSYGYQTYIHEIGHALGLGHQGPYNGSASYSTNAIYANDTWQYSIMSYFPENNYSGSSFRYVVTPQMADIYAMGSIYGASSTRTGDTIYGFNSNAGPVLNFGNYTSAPALTIYDSGGNDTLDCSNYSNAQLIDLRPGAFSSVGGLVNNIGIALSAVIEKAIGGAGNDTLIAGSAGSTLSGSGGSDTLIGGAGSDRLIGGSGVDTLTGGGGSDTFVFAFGASSAAAGQHDRVTDFAAGVDRIDLSGIDAIVDNGGVDLFRFIATAGFNGSAGELNFVYSSALGVTTLQGDVNGDKVADFAIDILGNVAINNSDLIGAVAIPVAIEALGATTLTQVGANYYLYANGTSSGPSLKFSGTAFVAGQFGTWTPIGAEVTGSGYEVAWKDTSSGWYTVWTTDSNGNYLSNIADMPGASATLVSAETRFSQDLNGDGFIGATVNTIEALGSTSLVQVCSNYQLNPVAGGSGPSLKYGGAAFVAGQFGTWTPIGAEATGSDYEVAWKDTSSGRYTVWTTDSNGNYLSNIADMPGTSATLASAETRFHQDFNGDAVIGASGATTGTTIEAFGSTSLVQVGSNYQLNPVAGGSGPSLKYGGAAFVSGQFGSWTPIGAEAMGSGYEVAWKDTSSGRYTVWTTDSNGNYLNNIADMPGTSATLASAETRFHQDLNGDGVIGATTATTGTTIEAFGSTSLVQVGSNYQLNPVAGGPGPSLKYGGAAFVSGQFGSWAPIGAEATGSGYEVAWKDTSSGRYTVWTTDSNGNYLSNIADMPGTSVALASAEARFHQDLNGDGAIASNTVLVSDNPTTQGAPASVVVNDAFLFRTDLNNWNKGAGGLQPTVATSPSEADPLNILKLMSGEAAPADIAGDYFDLAPGMGNFGGSYESLHFADAMGHFIFR